MTVIPIVVDARGTVFKSLDKRLKESEIGGTFEAIKTIALLRLSRILRGVLET